MKFKKRLKPNEKQTFAVLAGVAGLEISTFFPIFAVFGVFIALLFPDGVIVTLAGFAVQKSYVYYSSNKYATLSKSSP